MSRPTIVRLGVTAGIAAALVAMGVAVPRTISQPETTSDQVEPVGSSVLLCPEPGTGKTQGVRVTAAVVPGQPGQATGAGTAIIATLPGKESATAAIDAPGGQAEVAAAGRTLPPIEAKASGSLAPGFIANQWSRKPRGTGRGMASTACAPAGSDFWFMGGGATAGRQTRVVLVNPDDYSSVVDVKVIGPDGLIETPAGQGLVVKANSRLVVRMDVLAPGITATAVHVIARSGRVGAAVDDVQMSGLDAVGTDWIPIAAVPAKIVYVPDVMPGAGARVLTVAAPGDDDALVSIQVMTSEGTFAPADRDTMRVPAGTVQNMDLSSVIDGEPATVKLSSDVPIVAGMRQFFGAKKEQNETAFSAGSQPFRAAAAVSGLPVGASTRVHLQITATDKDAVVDVTVLPFGGANTVSPPTAPVRVTVPAGTVKWMQLAAPSGASWYTAVVTPTAESGRVLVAHRVREASSFGDLITGYPWRPLRTQVAVPDAVEDLAISVR